MEKGSVTEEFKALARTIYETEGAQALLTVIDDVIEEMITDDELGNHWESLTNINTRI